MTQELYTLADAARILAVKPYIVTYLLSTKKIPEPLRISGRRMFTVEDLARIDEFLKLNAVKEARYGY